MIFLRQSTVVVVALGPFVDSTDGFTPETALVISGADLRLRKHNDDWITLPASGSPTGAYHRENGWYDVELSASATDTAGPLKIACYESGALPVWIDATVLPQQVYDSLIGGTDTLDVQVTGLGAGTLTASALATDAVDEIVDAVWDEVLTAATHNVATSSGRRLRQLADVIVHAGTAQGPGTGTNQIQLDVGASATNGAYDPAVIAIVDGTGAGQCRLILQYAGATRTATVDRDWKVNPDATSVFQITANPGREHVNEGLAQAGAASTITLNALASSDDDTYIGQLVFLRAGTGADQVGVVTAYNGTTKVATTDPPWSVVPDSTTSYTMLPSGPVLLASVVHTGARVDANITHVIADPVQASSTKTTNWGGTP